MGASDAALRAAGSRGGAYLVLRSVLTTSPLKVPPQDNMIRCDGPAKSHPIDYTRRLSAVALRSHVFCFLRPPRRLLSPA